MNGSCGFDGKRRYLMDYIPDRTLFKAVMFARKMIREGTPAATANYRAANYYKVSVSDVAHYSGQAGGTSRGRRQGA